MVKGIFLIKDSFLREKINTNLYFCFLRLKTVPVNPDNQGVTVWGKIFHRGPWDTQKSHMIIRPIFCPVIKLIFSFAILVNVTFMYLSQEVPVDYFPPGKLYVSFFNS